MRTTQPKIRKSLAVEEALHEHLKQVAKIRGMKLEALVERLLKSGLKAKEAK